MQGTTSLNEAEEGCSPKRRAATLSTEGTVAFLGQSGVRPLRKTFLKGPVGTQTLGHHVAAVRLLAEALRSQRGKDELGSSRVHRLAAGLQLHGRKRLGGLLGR